MQGAKYDFKRDMDCGWHLNTQCYPRNPVTVCSS